MSTNTSSTRPWTVADLFSGSGGMSCGFERQGQFEIVGAVDRQVAKPSNYGGSGTSCNATYKRNIGIEPLDADLFELSPTEWRQDLGCDIGALDVLISCAPCTGFSQKNASNHTADDRRNGLVARSADFVSELMPRVFVMENVKELMTGRNRHHFELLRSELEGLGYSVFAAVHELVRFGLPQLRKRALVLAYRDGPIAPFHAPTVWEAGTVRDAIGHLPPLGAGQCDPDDPMHVAPRHDERSLERIRATPRDGGSWTDLLGTEHEHLLIPSMLREGRRRGSFPDIYGRLWWDQPARTITRECGHPGNGRYLHPEQDRMLSVREMALLQGFPPDYIFEGRVTSRYNQIGDAVPPLISGKVATHVARVLDGTHVADSVEPGQQLVIA